MRPECKGLNLGALLITPVQRVPRYPLVFQSHECNSKLFGLTMVIMTYEMMSSLCLHVHCS